MLDAMVETTGLGTPKPIVLRQARMFVEATENRRRRLENDDTTGKTTSLLAACVSTHEGGRRWRRSTEGRHRRPRTVSVTIKGRKGDNGLQPSKRGPRRGTPRLEVGWPKDAGSRRQRGPRTPTPGKLSG